jgi:hypothetical protein
MEREGGGGVFTVRATPTRTTTRLKDCCVVRAAFSPTLSSLQRTLPVSLTTVTCLRVGGGGGGVLVVELCVACDGREVVKAALGTLLFGIR